MFICDVRDNHIYTYSVADTIQKATVHMTRSSYKHQLLDKSDQEVIVLLDESVFLYYHVGVQVKAAEPFSRWEYKDIVQQHTRKVQSELGIRPEMLSFVIKNTRVNNQASDYYIWETWTISFDICYYALDQWYSDLIHLDHVKAYPRRFFLLQHPILTQKASAVLLCIEQDSTSAIGIRNGRYHTIHTLNGGDDLLRQAYEEVGLDPVLSKQKEFNEYSLGEKLLKEAHADFTDLMTLWLKEHTGQWEDLYVVSRLIDQPYFMRKFSESYLENFQWRVVPYRGSELMNSVGTWHPHELPFLLTKNHLS